MKINDLVGREILDSRGNPTVEVELFLSDGRSVLAAVPSGASTGANEALELRDNDMNRYMGKGVLTAVNNVNTIIRDAILDKDIDYKVIDRILLDLDGTDNKSKLGANAILAVSMAVLKAQALMNNNELFAEISDGEVCLPFPFMNILNGGMHADNNVDIQEFMIVPKKNTFSERLRLAAEVFHHLKSIIKSRGYSTGVGDEGGFAPNLNSNEEALDMIIEAINAANYIPGKDVALALDVAASSMYNEDTKTYKYNGESITTEELINKYLFLVDKYPITSIEDPFEENDFEAFAKLTELIGNRVMLVGDDFFVSNKKYLQKGVNMHAGNAILLKPNQIGSITELFETINFAKENNYKMIISHRSGETEDTTIADLVVGLNIPFIKSGSASRTDRICKYNRLLRIEEKLLNK